MMDIDPKSLPRPGQPEKAEVGLNRWLKAAESAENGEAMAAIAANTAGRAMLEAIFGNSPFLTQLMMRDPDFAARLLTDGPDAAWDAVRESVRAAVSDDIGLEPLMAVLRQGKNKTALLVAVADIAGQWPLESVTQALSDYADLALTLAVRSLLRQFAANGVIRLPAGPEPERDAGLVVLALGKLGAQELNYSSDIDIMVLYEPEKLCDGDPDALPQEMVRLTRLLMRVMDERTADGYVFRTDLRLRPDPGATPLAIPITAAETYYESVGQNWERAAMIRARAAAGDIAAGDAFLQHLRPFVWRKHLDFAAIQDIHSIKRQITAYRGGAAIAVNGHDIKIGRGGIREIEFFAQTQQLIWGGRFPDLRTRKLCETLDALATHGRVKPETAAELCDAYCYLRRLEHRLQMVDDHQTHALPKSDEQIDAIAAFMGYPDGDTFREALLKTLSKVESHYADLFEEAPDLGGSGTLSFTGTENHPETVETLERMGFQDGASVSTIVRRWHHGRYRATRSVRSRELLTELMPRLLEAFARRSEPNAAFVRFDAFLNGLPAGIQLFSLFYAYPVLLDLVAEIMGDAPTLAEWLSRNPNLLDHVLSNDFYQPLDDYEALKADLDAALTQANDYQDVLEITRRWTNDRKFQVGIQVLRGDADGHTTGPVLTAIAEIVLRALLPNVETEFAGPGDGPGNVPGGEIAVIALGKLGGRELMPGSDLDLVFVYDAPKGVDASDGAKPLAISVYFMRLSQRIVGAMEALTGEGRLYEIDTRLRPTGSKGPTATRLDGYVKYYEDSAWTWEYMALTRARVVAGSPDLMAKIDGIIQSVLTRPRDQDKLVVDIADMRVRIAKEHRGESRWDIKHKPGGLVDAEFIAQYLQLRHAADHPAILSPNAVEAFENLRNAGLLDAAAADGLADALRLWHRVQTILRITTSENLEAADAPAGPRDALARAANVESFESFLAHMDDTAKLVHGYFEDFIEVPAKAARDRLPKEDANARGD